MARSTFTVTFPAAQAGDEVTWPNTVTVYPDADGQSSVHAGYVDEAKQFVGYSEASSITFKHEASGTTVTVSAGGSGTGPAAPSAASGPTPIQVTDAYTAANSDAVLADATAADFTVTLPDPTLGTQVITKNVGATGSVHIAPAGVEHIDGLTSLTLAAGQSVTALADGSNWWRV